MQLRKFVKTVGSMYRNLQTFCSNRDISTYRRYNCCSHRLYHQSQFELLSYRTERIVDISIGTDRNILLFVVNNLLCFKGDVSRYFSRIVHAGT